jgi:hypothetical protein
MQELLEVYRRISEQHSLPSRYCFFIDGLDEYDGKEEDMVESLRFLSNTTSREIKICVSSRPRTLFTRIFNDSGRTLIMQEYTWKDMTTYVQKKLCESDAFKALDVTQKESRRMVNDIAEHAQGVWLWVYLVISALIQAMNRNESFRSLQKILLELPSELEGVFQHITDSVEKRYRKQMAQIILVALESHSLPDPFPMHAFCLLEEEESDPDYVFNCNIKTAFTKKELEITNNRWIDRVHTRCSYLIEANTSHLRFPHRSVRDFFRDSCYMQLINESGSDFKATMLLVRMELFDLKVRTGPSLPIAPHSYSATMMDNVRRLMRKRESPESSLYRLLEEANILICMRDAWCRRSWPEYRSSGRRGPSPFVQFAIKRGLTFYVRTKLELFGPKAYLPPQTTWDSFSRFAYCVCQAMLEGSRFGLVHGANHQEKLPYREEVSDMLEVLFEYGLDPIWEFGNLGRFPTSRDARMVWGNFISNVFTISGSCPSVEPGIDDSTTRKEALHYVCQAFSLYWEGKELDTPTAVRVVGLLSPAFGEEAAAYFLKNYKQSVAGDATGYFADVTRILADRYCLVRHKRRVKW